MCRSTEHEDVLSLPSLPVLLNAQVRPDDARDVVRGDIDLVACLQCGHLYNRSFDDSLLAYDASYENTLHFSARFREFAEDLAARLVADHDLAGAEVAELGSGPGHFLSMLCDAGVRRGVGFDPSYDPDRLGAPDRSDVSISCDLFPGDGSLAVRLAYSQHVLEHLDDPVRALTAQRGSVSAMAGVVYSEVPNGQLMLEQCALWDLIYEHLSYFVPSSLDLACRRAGLDVTRMGSAFGDQFLWCEAVPVPELVGFGDSAEPDPGAVADAVEMARRFGGEATERIAGAREELARFVHEGPVILWGAGSKGMTYLNLVADVAPVAGVVDINPRKVGWGVPGTSLVISGPEAMTDVRPRTVLAANPVYVGEISADLASRGVDADVRALWG